MSHGKGIISGVSVRDGLALSQPQLRLAVAAVAAATSDDTPTSNSSSSPLRRRVDVLHHYSLGAFALLFLIVAAAGIEVGGRYWLAKTLDSVKPAIAAKAAAPTISGLNLTVPAKDLQSKLQTIANQPASLTVGSQSVPLGADTIRGWLQITPSKDKTQDYIRIKAGAMASSLTALANTYVKAPVNQVTVTHTDGVSPSGVVVTGQNGTKLTDPGSLAAQSQQQAKTVMNANGLQFNTPLQTVPFQAVTPAAFPKLLEADVTTDRLYAWQDGQLVNTFLSSAGAPDTPTPLGQFQIWAKFTSQTMKGTYPVAYVQPNVPYVNYFDHSGDAVHGNYWRPASVFGSTNTSHGCVSVQVGQAEWIYDWAPIGTTVITHA